MNCYKIKVGIEEYSVKEVDVPRIVEAMKTNDMVKLDCGIFRGQSILAVCRDFDEESRQVMLSAPSSESKRIEDEQVKRIKKQKDECNLCNHTGYVFVDRNGEQVAKYCSCTILKEIAVI